MASTPGSAAVATSRSSSRLYAAGFSTRSASNPSSTPVRKPCVDAKDRLMKPCDSKNGATATGSTPYTCVNRPGTAFSNTPSSSRRSRNAGSASCHRSSGSDRSRRTETYRGMRATATSPPGRVTRASSRAARARSAAVVRWYIGPRLRTESKVASPQRERSRASIWTTSRTVPAGSDDSAMASSSGDRSARVTSQPSSASHTEYGPVPPPRSSARPGAPRWGSRSRVVRTRSRRPSAESSRSRSCWLFAA